MAKRADNTPVLVLCTWYLVLLDKPGELTGEKNEINDQFANARIAVLSAGMRTGYEREPPSQRECAGRVSGFGFNGEPGLGQTETRQIAASPGVGES